MLLSIELLSRFVMWRNAGANTNKFDYKFQHVIPKAPPCHSQSLTMSFPRRRESRLQPLLRHSCITGLDISEIEKSEN